jgi:hypothetical protein
MKIYVVDIIKKYRNGELKKILVIEAGDKEDLDSQVEEWCRGESSGAVYGWTASYEIVEDKALMKKAFEEKFEEINREINILTHKLYQYREEYDKNIYPPVNIEI